MHDQAEKEAQIGVDLSSLEKAQKEAAADRMLLEVELKQLRGEHSSLRVWRPSMKRILWDFSPAKGVKLCLRSTSDHHLSWKTACRKQSHAHDR